MINGATDRGDRLTVSLGLTEKVLAIIITVLVAGWAGWVSSSLMEVKEELAALRLNYEVAAGSNFTSRDASQLISTISALSERVSVLNVRLLQLEREMGVP